MSEDAAISKKVKKAAQLLLYQHHRLPGSKGWEIKKILGKDYMKVIKLLERKFDDLGLEIKIVYSDGIERISPTEEDLEQARFYVLSKVPMQSSEVSLSGWRIDTLAVLAAALALITSKQGKATRREAEELLQEKLPDWKVDQDLNRFIRKGYLDEDEAGLLFIGWRTRAEIDLKKLMGIIAGSLPEEKAES
ncbi:MAG TPA: hypothetical protein P5168_00540 [Candidatus Methanomethylicus sp.]|nr:hypothetical protein [Candidatus Methanomethylicus sp.]HRR54044.1 hypothetical protein [Candidatus Methanomethylicus sp.]HRU81014.1 hypothetical protein [Candidatus Methanomethylicus sp.]